MRLLVVFSVSFAFSAIIWTLIFPAPPPSKPKPSARLAVVQTTQAVTNPFDFLPAPPSSITPFTSASQEYEVARQLMMKGRLREAQDQYLKILLTKSSIDQKALQGLSRVQGLLAHGDPGALQQQAEAYRLAIARGSETEYHHNPRALELLAEANLLAAHEIQAEQSPGSTPIGSTVPIVSGLRESSLPVPGTSSHVPAPLAPSALGQQVVRLGQVLTPGSAGPLPPPGESLQPSSSDQSITIPIPVLNNTPGGSSSGASDSGASKNSGSGGSNGSWGGAVKGGAGSGRGGNTSSWGSTSDEGSDSEKLTNK